MFSIKSLRPTHLKDALALCFLLYINYSYGQPIISNFSPASGPVGTTVTISGSGFDPTASNNKVSFGTINANIVSASSTSLAVTVPAGINSRPITVRTNGLIAYSNLPFSVSFPGPDPFNFGAFTSEVNFSAPNSRQSISSADFDLDAKLDIITTYGNRFTIHRNASSSTGFDFSVTVVVPISGFGGALGTGDLDCDGKEDVVICDMFSQNMYLFRNTSTIGNISFQQMTTLSLPTPTSQLVIRDVDSDGKPDLIAAGGSLTVIPNTSIGGVWSFGGQIPLTCHSLIQVADINGDNKMDLISKNGYQLGILVNNSTPGNFSIQSPVFFDIGAGINSHAIEVANITDDTTPDLAVAAMSNTDSYIFVYKNLSAATNISLAAPLILSTDLPGALDIGVSDLDGDTKPDLIWSNESHFSLSVFKNTSTATASFGPKVNYSNPAQVHFYTLEVADFTNDGKPDIAGLSKQESMLSLLRNTLNDPAAISQITPNAGSTGQHVTILGENFANATGVSFGGLPAYSFSIISDNNIDAVVGQTAATGPVVVNTPINNASSSNFTFTPRPSIFSFTPLFGPVGQQVRIRGENFNSVPSNNTVYFGGAKALVVSGSNTHLDVIVPPGAIPEPISVSTNGLCAMSKLSYVITFPGGNLMSSTFAKAFEQPNYSNTTENVRICDLDGDGKNDILTPVHTTTLGGSYHDSIAVYRNTTLNGVVSFAQQALFKTPASLTVNVNFADFDGDGKLDVVAQNEFFDDLGSISIFRNISTPGNLSFLLQPDYIFYVDDAGLSNIAIADIDKDGKLDIVVSDGLEKLRVFRNTSIATSISFTDSKILSLPGNLQFNGAPCIHDIDGDSIPEIIAGQSASDSFLIFKNRSTPGFLIFDSPIKIKAGSTSESMTIADMDGDNNLDIILGTYDHTEGINDTITVLRNQSTPGVYKFDYDNRVTLATRASRVVLNDINGDGKLDIVTLSGNFYVFRNSSANGNLSFDPRVGFPINTFTPMGIAVGDLDMDAKPDVVTGKNGWGHVINVFVNQNPSENFGCSNSQLLIHANLQGSTYQWQLNTGSGFVNIVNGGNFAGANSSLLTVTNVPSNWNGYQFRCMVNGVAGKVTIARFSNRWTGAADSAWENPNNWSCGMIPDSTTNVIISSGTVNVNSNVTIRTLRLDAGATLNVNPSNTITITN